MRGVPSDSTSKRPADGLPLQASKTATAETGQPSGREPARAGRSAGALQLIQQSKPVLGSDVRRLPALVALSFVMGFAEACLVYLVVQMGVALAGGEEQFSFELGPITLHEIGLLRGAGFGAMIVALLAACLVPVAKETGRLPARAQERTRRHLLDTYLQASWDVRAQFPEGHLQELLTTYTMRAERAVTQLVLASTAACGLAAILLTAFVASPIAAAGALGCVAAMAVCLRPLMLRTRAASRGYAESDRRFAGRTAEIARLTPEIAAFDVADQVAANVGEQASEVAVSLQRIRTSLRLGSGMYQYTALLLILLAVAVASSAVDGSQLATVGGVLLLLVRALTYGQQLQGQVQQAQETAPFLERMRAEIDELHASRVDRDGTTTSSVTPLQFDDVWFSYDGATDVLRGISFRLDHGESLGIVGRSGAGKSTIVQLLLRLRSPTGGEIATAGVPLDQVSLQRWYQMVSYVPQENKLTRGTIADNIRFFRPHVTDEAIVAASRRAHLHDDIESLPEGYATEVGPGARDLSGGQRQRLGIARALAGNPSMLVLDEPTSALDARSEHLITETLRELRGEVSTVIVAHRPATLANCDHILRIDGGVGTLEPGPANIDPDPAPHPRSGSLGRPMP